jgi:hypothetical protein
MDWIETQLDDENVFPQKLGEKSSVLNLSLNHFRFPIAKQTWGLSDILRGFSVMVSEYKVVPPSPCGIAVQCVQGYAFRGKM